MAGSELKNITIRSNVGGLHPEEQAEIVVGYERETGKSPNSCQPNADKLVCGW